MPFGGWKRTMKQQTYEKQFNLGKNSAINFLHTEKNQEFPPLSGRLQKQMSQKLLWC